MGRSLLRRASWIDVSGITPTGCVPSTPYPGDSLTVDSGVVFGEAQAAMRKMVARAVRRFILTSVTGLLLLRCWGCRVACSTPDTVSLLDVPERARQAVTEYPRCPRRSDAT